MAIEIINLGPVPSIQGEVGISEAEPEMYRPTLPDTSKPVLLLQASLRAMRSYQKGLVFGETQEASEAQQCKDSSRLCWTRLGGGSPFPDNGTAGGAPQLGSTPHRWILAGRDSIDPRVYRVRDSFARWVSRSEIPLLGSI